MSKGIIISFILFVVALTMDIFSLRPVDKQSSFDKLEAFVETELSHYKDLLSSKEYVEIFQSSKLSSSQLKKIQDLEAQLESNKVFTTVYKNNQLLYWKNGDFENSYCKMMDASDSITVNLGIEVYNNSNQLNPFIYDKSGILHQVTKTDALNATNHLLGYFPVDIGKRYRSKSLNLIIILTYLLSILFLILNCIRKQRVGVFGALAGFRILLFSFPWQARFDNLSFTQEIFEYLPYTSLDIIIDTFLVTGGLIFLSKSSTRLNTSNNKAKGILNLSFLSFLFLAHLRIIQWLMMSPKMDTSINNLSALGTDDLLVFSVSLGLLASIFIYATSITAVLKKIWSRQMLYGGFLSSAIICGLGSFIFGLEVNPWMYGLFILSFYALLDLFIDIKYKTLTWAIWWAILFGIYLSAVLFNFDIKKDISERKEFLQEIYHEIDPTEISSIKSNGTLDSIQKQVAALLTLEEEAIYDRNDFIKFLKEKNKRKDFYVEIFDEEGRNIFDENFEFPRYISRINSKLKFDPFENIIWFSQNHLNKFDVNVGFNLEKTAFKQSYEFNYYKDGFPLKNDIALSQDEYNFIRNCEKDIAFRDSDLFIKHEIDNSKMLVTKKSFFGLIKPIALFSLLFSAIILLIILSGILYMIVDYLPADWPFKFKHVDSLNSKIQISLILVILFSFIIIAIITSSFLKSFISTNNITLVENKINAIANDINRKIKISDSEEATVLIAKNYQEELEKIHSTELDIVRLDSNYTKQEYYPSVYFGKQTSPPAYTQYLENDETKNFIPLLYKDKTVGYTELNFNPRQTQKINVFDFLGSIFNVYVFLFLIASVFAIFIARSITKPLSLLNQKLSQLKLGKRNELISWEKEDEIGTLISNYNNMVNQLEESAQLLAKTERDSAWREMAKQVAHEIKNPLTPMKMYIQHLEKAIQQQPHNAKEISKKISNTLMEQIDNLTEIANSFSNFAELPQTANAQIELNNVVQVVHNLFRKRKDMEFSLSEPIDTIHVYADKNQLIRILNNLVKNAVEAIPDSKKGKIELLLYTKEEKAIIKLTDNGVGIPDNMKEKIFQPKFTTKDSGSGLGLAIAANMIESMNGRLYFDSIEGIGTNFYIELDIIRSAHFKDKLKRVTLE